MPEALKLMENENAIINITVIQFFIFYFILFWNISEITKA